MKHALINTLGCLLLAGAYSSCGGSAFAKLETDVEEFGVGLERTALELYRFGSADRFLKTKGEDRYPAAGASLAELERESQRYAQKRRDLDAEIDRLGKLLGPQSNSDAAALARVDAVRDQLTSAAPDLDEFGQGMQKRIKFVADVFQDITGARKSPARAKGVTLDQVFENLHTQFPHWKDDIAKIETDHKETILSLTTGCPPGANGNCDPVAQTDVETAVRRLHTYRDLTDALTKNWGPEIGADIGDYMARNPRGLLADIVAVSADHAQRLRVLQAQLDWVLIGLKQIDPSSDPAAS